MPVATEARAYFFSYRPEKTHKDAQINTPMVKSAWRRLRTKGSDPALTPGGAIFPKQAAEQASGPPWLAFQPPIPTAEIVMRQ